MKIIELDKGLWKDFVLRFEWSSNSFYKVNVSKVEDGWIVELKLQKNEIPQVKVYREPLWQQWMDEESDDGAKIFGAEIDSKIVG